MNQKIEFISYDGKYPCLCDGILTVKINGNICRFSNCIYSDYDEKSQKLIYNKNDYPRFWKSGGCIQQDDEWNMWSEKGPWEIDLSTYCQKEYFTKEILDLMDDLIKMFNEHVPQGCCGGCI